MEKSPDAYRTISEVADELGLPQHVLRFWETRFPQIKPLKRGGGRRYYKPDDIDLVRGIQTLLYSEGYTIKGVQRILKEDGVKPVQMVGRGTAFVGDRSNAEEPDEDMFAADENEADVESTTELRATRDPISNKKVAARKDPMMSVAAEPAGKMTPLAAKHEDIAPAPSRTPRKAIKSSSEPLQIALSELQECTRLIDLLREKA